MKYLNPEHMRDADSGEDVQESSFLLEARLAEVRQHRQEIQDRKSGAFADLLLEEGRLLIRLEKMPEAWEVARAAFDLHLANENWQGAVEACDVLFAADQPDSLAALGQAMKDLEAERARDAKEQQELAAKAAQADATAAKLAREKTQWEAALAADLNAPASSAAEEQQPAVQASAQQEDVREPSTAPRVEGR